MSKGDDPLDTAAVFIVFTLYTDIRNYCSGASPLVNSLMGLVWVALGIPGYLWWSLRRKPEPQPCPAA